MTRNDERIGVPERSIEILDLISDMWKTLRRTWIVYLLLICLFSTTGYFYVKKTFRPSYTAYATFTVNAATVYGYSKIEYNMTAAAQLGKTFPYLLTNDVLQERIADELGVEEVPGTISASVLNNTNLVNLTVRAEDGQTAYDILQAVIRNYPYVSRYVLGDLEIDRLDESGVPAEQDRVVTPRWGGMMGAVCAAMVSLVILIIISGSRKSVSSEEDLKKLFHIPCLGNVPGVRLKKRRGRKPPLLLTESGVPQYYREAVRTVRYRLEDLCKEYGVRTILVTSAAQGEGKTTMAANLALSLANKGRKVALIDADLRNPSIKELFGMKTEKGLYEYLDGKTELLEVMSFFEDRHELSVIPGGSVTSGPAEHLAGHRMQDLIEELKKSYDYVIIDTPPSAVVSDASILARYADGGLYVVRQDYCRREALVEGMKMHAGTGIRMLGTVFNYTSTGLPGSRHGYGNYGYGRYGSYGYENTDGN